MANKIQIPVQLQKSVGGQPILETNGKTIKEVILEIGWTYPDFQERVYGKGTINQFLLFFVNDEDIRFLNGENTQLKDGDSMTIISAIAGG